MDSHSWFVSSAMFITNRYILWLEIGQLYKKINNKKFKIRTLPKYHTVLINIKNATSKM